MTLLNAITKRLGFAQEDPRGWAHFSCPKCGSKGKPKFGINIRDRRFGCFLCHWNGDLWEILDFLGIDPRLVGRAGRATKKEKPAHNYTAITIPGFVPITATPTKSVVEAACLKFCWNRAGMHLSRAQIAALGWGYSTDPALFWRLIIPVVMDGIVVQYLARALDPGQEPKELPAPNRPGCPTKGEVLWGAPIRPGLPLVLTEGVWDALASEAAYPLATATAILGTSLSSYLIGYLLRKRPGTVILLLDGDEPGAHGSAKIARKLMARHGQVLVARPPVGKDPKAVPKDELFHLITHAEPAATWLLRQAAARPQRVSVAWSGRPRHGTGPK